MAIFFLLLVFLASSILLSTGSVVKEPFEDRQGISRSIQIVGGSLANIEKYPYQVSLQFNNQHFCGGSIIKASYILTAAHCVRDIGNRSITIRAGTSVWESGGTVIEVASITTHPNYAKETPQDYDISILQLKKPLTLSKTIQIIRLASLRAWFLILDERADGTLGTITGWGALSETEGIPKQLMATDISVVNKSTCAKQHAVKKHIITDRMICATAPFKDACYGDSGGPFVSNRCQIGITSWSYGCARDGFPGVYTNLALQKISYWIKSIINPNMS